MNCLNLNNLSAIIYQQPNQQHKDKKNNSAKLNGAPGVFFIQVKIHMYVYEYVILIILKHISYSYTLWENEINVIQFLGIKTLEANEIFGHITAYAVHL